MDTGYPHGSKTLIVGQTLEILKDYQKRGFEFIVVTNQTGLAKNKFSLSKMQGNLQSIVNCYHNKEVGLLDVAFCPYHPDSVFPEYKFLSLVKNKSCIILKMDERYWINVRNSVMLETIPRWTN